MLATVNREADGERLREVRKRARGLSWGQRMLAQTSCITGTSLSQWCKKTVRRASYGSERFGLSLCL